jgi:hypothetical protein
MAGDIGREQQGEGIKKDSIDCDKASYKLIINPPTLSAKNLDKPSMALKRKESVPKSACCISEIRVFLHENDQYGMKIITDVPEHTWAPAGHPGHVQRGG